MANPGWFRTGALDELIASIEFAANCFDKVPENPENWRWVVISLHLAVQGALVCALKGYDTTGVSVLSEPAASRMLEWLQDGQAKGLLPPNQHLASVRELLKRAQTVLPPEHKLEVQSTVVDDVLRLSELRNNFVHISVDGWSLDMSGLPRIVTHAVDVVEFLTLKAPTFWHQIEPEQTEKIQSAVNRLRKSLGAFEIA